MNRRRLAALVLLMVLLAGAGAALWRAVHAPSQDPAAAVAAALRCPACQGESVAQSRSPVAAAMRASIAEQLAAGRSPTQIRSWFIDRYGPQVLAEPPLDGVGALLWIMPAAALALACLLAIRAARRRIPAAARAGPVTASPAIASPRVWDRVAVGLVGIVTAVAVMSRTGPDTAARDGAGPDGAPPAAAATQDPVQARLMLAESLERQGQYAAAADLYRQVASERPDDHVRLRLSFALIRAGRPDEAASTARHLLATRPDDPEALLMLGLAQRATNSPAAAATLRRFLALAPRNPAADQVRRLLAQRGN